MDLATMVLMLTVLNAPGHQEKPRQPLHHTIDLNVGESQSIELSDGSKATVKLLDMQETRDSVRAAIREARVKIEINGQTTTLVSGNYRLPESVGGVQVDCTATKIGRAHV